MTYVMDGTIVVADNPNSYRQDRNSNRGRINTHVSLWGPVRPCRATPVMGAHNGPTTPRRVSTTTGYTMYTYGMHQSPWGYAHMSTEIPPGYDMSTVQAGC